MKYSITQIILVIAVVALVVVGISVAVLYGHSDNTPSTDPEQTTYTYSIGYDGNGADWTPSTTMASSTSESYMMHVSLTEPTRSSYTFNGWLYDEKIYQPNATITLTVAVPHVTLTAQWTYIEPTPTPTTYTYTAELQYTDGIPSETHSYSTTSTTPSGSYDFTVTDIIPVQEGYTFDNWTDGATDYVSGNVIAVAYGDTVTLSSVWTEIPIPEYTYTATLAYDVEGIESQADSYTTTDTTPSGNATFAITDIIPTMSGYDFTNWTDGTSTYVSGDSIEVPYGTTITLAAEFTAIPEYTYTATLNYDHDIPSQTASYTTTDATPSGSYDFVITDSIPVKAYHTFDDWTDGVNTYVAGDVISVAYGDTVSLVSEWTENPLYTYTIVYWYFNHWQYKSTTTTETTHETSITIQIQLVSNIDVWHSNYTGSWVTYTTAQQITLTMENPNIAFYQYIPHYTP